MAKPRVPKASENEVRAAESNGNGGANNGGAKKAVRRKNSAKPEIVKSDARATLLPINLDDEIRRLAYLMAERRGFEPGHEAEDWFAAEQEVRQRYHQYSA